MTKAGKQAKTFANNKVSIGSHTIKKSAKKQTNINGLINNLCTELSNTNIRSNNDAIIYTRVSTTNQTFGMSLDSQYQLCRKYCFENNLDIISTVRESVSAREINKQTQLQQIIQSNQNINLIINEPTRFSRNMKDAVNLMDQCKNKKIIIHFVQDNLVSNNNSDIKKIVSGVFDGEIESNTLGLRMKRSIAHRKKLGIYQPAIAKYGYMYDYKYSNGKQRRILKQNMEEQQIINLINKLYYGSNISQVESLLVRITKRKHDLYNPNDINEDVDKIEYGNFKFTDIANFLNSIPIYKRNKLWSGQSISKLIQNDDYKNSIDTDSDDESDNDSDYEPSKMDL
jgi:DNA invertase Pin-like site-specific DNA recombinase